MLGPVSAKLRGGAYSPRSCGKAAASSLLGSSSTGFVSCRANRPLQTRSTPSSRLLPGLPWPFLVDELDGLQVVRLHRLGDSATPATTTSSLLPSTLVMSLPRLSLLSPPTVSHLSKQTFTFFFASFSSSPVSARPFAEPLLFSVSFQALFGIGTSWLPRAFASPT